MPIKFKGPLAYAAPRPLSTCNSMQRFAQPPVYRPDLLKNNTIQRVSAPPIYRPMSVNQAVQLRPAPPVYRPISTAAGAAISTSPRAQLPAQHPLLLSRTLQRMEAVPEVGYTAEAIGQRDWILLLAIKAYEHMRSLVIRNNKDGAKDKLHREDQLAADYYQDSTKVSDVSAYAKVQGVGYYSVNSAQSGGLSLIESSDCNHAEMKLFQHFGHSADYIGVSRLCCLYCAAQMLAAGFTRFRGCHMKSFTGYQWLPEIATSASFRAALWGAEVEQSLKRMSLEEWQDFLGKVSNGANLLSKFWQYYNAHYQPLYPKNAENPYSASNQKNYPPSGP